MIKKIKVSELKANKENPRTVSKEKFSKLKKSITNFPKMLKLRPIVIDDNNTVLGGNMRLKALKSLGIKETWCIKASDLNEEEKEEFIIKDNVGFGDWDFDILANNFEITKLEEFGIDLWFNKDDITEMKNPDNNETENKFATELDSESNYIVLKFSKDIDWIQAKTLFNLQTEVAQRANGKKWSQGIGRVIDGVNAIKIIKNEN
jgi:hypothetical protein